MLLPTMILPSFVMVIFGPLSVLGHGNMVWPPTWFGPNRTIDYQKPEDFIEGNDFNKSLAMWFSNWTFIPGVATLDPSLYTLPDFHGDAYRTKPYYPTTPDRNPWTAPGTARVFSPCGVAGGNPFGMSSTNYEINEFAGGFSYGSDARNIDWKDAVFTEWQRGGKAEVGWGIEVNHGGGYSYRLCKVGEDGPGGVTEDCFQKTPLKLSGNSWVQYGTDESTRVMFKANRTEEGTYPGGSQWTMNPIPVYSPVCNDDIWGKKCPEFPARVKGLLGYGRPLFNSTLMDEVEVPEDLEPGKYVLSFRWDCEATPQIWNACSNILIV